MWKKCLRLSLEKSKNTKEAREEQQAWTQQKGSISDLLSDISNAAYWLISGLLNSQATLLVSLSWLMHWQKQLLQKPTIYSFVREKGVWIIKAFNQIKLRSSRCYAIQITYKFIISTMGLLLSQHICNYNWLTHTYTQFNQGLHFPTSCICNKQLRVFLNLLKVL